MHHPLSLATRLILLPFWPVYRLLVGVRAGLFRLGFSSPLRAPMPVVSVGNLTLGGSGKTPFTEYLVRMAQQAGLSPAILSRGYGRRGKSMLLRLKMEEGFATSPEWLGDEPYLLAQRNPRIPLYIGADRAQGARLAHFVDHPGVVVLDDGYQHRRLARDLDVLLIDAEGGLGNGCVLPWGILREPKSAMARADAIVITKAGLGDGPGLAAWVKQQRGVSAPVFLCDYRPARLRRLDGGGEMALGALKGRGVSLCCAIAHPGGFASSLTGLGAEIRHSLLFPDHHAYPPATLERLAGMLALAGEEEVVWVTTEKDAVKLHGRLAQPEKMWVLEMEVDPEPAAQAFFFDFLSALPLK